MTALYTLNLSNISTELSSRNASHQIFLENVENAEAFSGICQKKLNYFSRNIYHRCFAGF